MGSKEGKPNHRKKRQRLQHEQDELQPPRPPPMAGPGARGASKGLLLPIGARLRKERRTKKRRRLVSWLEARRV